MKPGHAIAIHECEHADPVYKITIIGRGQSGGYTLSLPEQDSLLMSKNKILARIIGLMGGRAAEEIFFHDITTGASNDLTVATQLAEEMVMRLGMDNSTGLRVFQQPQGLAALAAPRGSQKTFETIDDAVKAILDDCYNQACQILTEKRQFVDRVASELLEVETISRIRFVELMNGILLNNEATDSAGIFQCKRREYWPGINIDLIVDGWRLCRQPSPIIDIKSPDLFPSD